MLLALYFKCLRNMNGNLAIDCVARSLAPCHEAGARASSSCGAHQQAPCRPYVLSENARREFTPPAPMRQAGSLLENCLRVRPMSLYPREELVGCGGSSNAE